MPGRTGKPLNSLGEVATAAARTPASPYTEFIEILTTFILPAFENFTASSMGIASRPGSPGSGRGRSGESEVTDGGSSRDGGGGGGRDKQILGSGEVIDGSSLAAGSLALNPVAGSSGGDVGGALPTDLPPGAESIAGGGDGVTSTSSPLRVIKLEVTEISEAEADAETAQSLLPEPQVPAPDPKVVAIPPEKLRQQVRRPVPRMQRPPLQTLEILPVQPLDPSPPSSRPGSRNATSKPSVGGAAKTEQQGKKEANLEPDDEKAGGEGGVGRASSGALEGNPYRWVVSASACCACMHPTIGTAWGG